MKAFVNRYDDTFYGKYAQKCSDIYVSKLLKIFLAFFTLITDGH